MKCCTPKVQNINPYDEESLTKQGQTAERINSYALFLLTMVIVLNNGIIVNNRATKEYHIKPAVLKCSLIVHIK